MKRRHLLLVAALPGAAVAQGRAARDDLDRALRLAGSQRTLSQRMGKAWLAQGAAGPRAGAVLADTQDRFERQMAELQRLAPTPEIAGGTRALAHRYQAYREALARPADAQSRAAVVQRAGEVLTLSQIGIEQWRGQARSEPGGEVPPSAWLLNLCGQQRLASQRLALLTLAGAPLAERRPLVHAFEATAAVLAAAPATREPVRQTLAVADAYWAALKTAPDAAAIFNTSEGLLAVLDNAMAQYARSLT